eukprot:TRINITY_DN18805_c0_g1_i2.p1 TRINITY_DN18805_c0_g1~~TRINITY_DN18805_c0_g1_i2.p1  ORF type:complete len:697 (+),score=216.20 TRINITY_DN18805_c0_g1_i2:43-2133(+)
MVARGGGRGGQGQGLCRMVAASSFALGGYLLTVALGPAEGGLLPEPPAAPAATTAPAAPPVTAAQPASPQRRGAASYGYATEDELPPSLLRRVADLRASCQEGGRAADDGGRGAPPWVDPGVGLTSLERSEVVFGSQQHVTGVTEYALIVSRSATGAAVCRGGDMFEVRYEGEDEHDAPRVSDLGHGAYAVRWLPRLAGARKFCLYLYYPGRVQGLPRWPGGAPRPFHLVSRTKAFKAMDNVTSSLGPPSTWCLGTEPDLRPRCIDVAVTGSAQLPAQQCQDAWRGGLTGSWLKVPGDKCRPGYCAGDLRFMDSDGWVYVPRDCYLRLYNREAAWNCLSGRSLLWFGDSTLRQSATNMVELLLGTPVLGEKSFKWTYAHCSRYVLPKGSRRVRGSSRRLSLAGKEAAKRGCPDYNSIRNWAGHRVNPENTSQSLHVNFVWGGGWLKNTLWGERPAALDHTLPDGRQAGRRWTCAGGPHRGCSPARSELLSALSSDRRPDTAFLNGLLWDMDAHDWDRFGPKVESLLDLLNQKMAPGARVHWNMAHPQCLDDRREETDGFCRSTLVNKMQTVLAAHSNEMLQHTMETVWRDRFSAATLTATDRFAVAQPYVHGHDFCHQGMHFGSSKHDCYMFDSMYPEPCYRQWRVDKFMSQVWMNAACPADKPPLETGSHSIEDGVPKAAGNWLPHRQGNPEPTI